LPLGAGSMVELLAGIGLRDTLVTADGIGVVCRLESGRADEAVAAMRSAGFVMLVDLFALDAGDHLEITYHLRRLIGLADVYVKTRLAYDGEAPSVWRVYPAALYPEREAAELFGITFTGHPNPKRLLTTDESGPPALRKAVRLRTAEEVALRGRV
jgi:NADH:ubiquinone oxidoreductase subunit C